MVIGNYHFSKLHCPKYLFFIGFVQYISLLKTKKNSANKKVYKDDEVIMDTHLNNCNIKLELAKNQTSIGKYSVTKEALITINIIQSLNPEMVPVSMSDEKSL